MFNAVSLIVFLVDLPFYKIVRKYKVGRARPLPTRNYDGDRWTKLGNLDFASYEQKYPKSLFNKGVRTQYEDHIGHVMKETEDKIVVWGHYDWRFDIPKSKIIAVGMDTILGMDYEDVFQYEVDRHAPLPSGQPIDTLGNED